MEKDTNRRRTRKSSELGSILVERENLPFWGTNFLHFSNVLFEGRRRAASKLIERPSDSRLHVLRTGHCLERQNSSCFLQRETIQVQMEGIGL